MCTIQSLFIINKAGSLIYYLDNNKTVQEFDKIYNYPIPQLLFDIYDDKVQVSFGEVDGIKAGMVIASINDELVNGTKTKDDQQILEYLKHPKNYPLKIKFVRLKLNSNEKITMASMFHSLYAISSQIAPSSLSSGIKYLESETFNIHCHQTRTGMKFIVIVSNKSIFSTVDTFMKRLHEIYADYALKNPFYSLEMPIRSEKFDHYITSLVELAEKNINY